MAAVIDMELFPVITNKESMALLLAGLLLLNAYLAVRALMIGTSWLRARRKYPVWHSNHMPLTSYFREHMDFLMIISMTIDFIFLLALVWHILAAILFRVL